MNKQHIKTQSHKRFCSSCRTCQTQRQQYSAYTIRSIHVHSSTVSYLTSHGQPLIFSTDLLKPETPYLDSRNLIPWHINNKYYTADIHFRLLDLLDSPASPASEPVLIYLYSGKVSYSTSHPISSTLTTSLISFLILFRLLWSNSKMAHVMFPWLYVSELTTSQWKY